MRPLGRRRAQGAEQAADGLFLLVQLVAVLGQLGFVHLLADLAQRVLQDGDEQRPLVFGEREIQVGIPPILFR